MGRRQTRQVYLQAGILGGPYQEQGSGKGHSLGTLCSETEATHYKVSRTGKSRDRKWICGGWFPFGVIESSRSKHKG